MALLAGFPRHECLGLIEAFQSHGEKARVCRFPIRSFFNAPSVAYIGDW
jgi:hypothetical protein